MQQPESLRLTGSRGCRVDAAVLYPLARALHGMPRLTAVSLAQSATDNALRVLAQACPGLEELNVAASRAVTDKGVAALAACAHLRVLKVAATTSKRRDVCLQQGRTFIRPANNGVSVV